MTDYELTRRDALAALATAGVATGASALVWESLDDETPADAPTLATRDREMLYAVAEVVYPSAVTGVEEFVETYVVGRVRERPDRLRGLVEALDYLDTYAREWYGDPFLDLPAEKHGAVLSAMGADVAEPDPDGSDVEKLRFYLVNELFYALYTSPTGGKLVGLENPQGHPGGSRSYQRPPE